jgi:murein DD-endopeptidase MepM/ murein hydrolase activator NlpD
MEDHQGPRLGQRTRNAISRAARRRVARHAVKVAAANPATLKVAAIAAPLAVVAAVIVLLAVGSVIATTAATSAACGAPGGRATEAAVAGFDGRYWRGPDEPGSGVPPRNFIGLYFAAAQAARLGDLGPYVLMAIHEIESSFGRSSAPGVKSGVNTYGCCKGPFQFYDLASASTWRAYARDGDGDGDKDVYSNVDAGFAAAAYLKASGAPGSWSTAIFAYNRAGWYVRQVLARASYFQGRITQPTPETAIEQTPVLTGETPVGVGTGGTQTVGASEFGGPGDPGTGSGGYRGDNLTGKNAYAELGYTTTTNESNSRTGKLGNLPYKTPAQIVYQGREITAYKLDVGKGGDPVRGRTRAVDLWWQTANQLQFSGTDLVQFTRLDGGGLPDATLGQPPGCAAPAGTEQIATDGGAYRIPLPKNSYTVTSLFWESRSYENHPGVDLAAPTGTPIYASGAGRVSNAGWAGGYGNYTCIQHTQTVRSCYGHQSQILVNVGDTVQAGQKIGAVGSTGNSTGPHLHFEFRRNGSVRCPASYIGITPLSKWCAAGAPGITDQITATGR